jgi:hypothetical protein
VETVTGLGGKLSGIRSYTRAKIKPKRASLAAWSGFADPQRISVEKHAKRKTYAGNNIHPFPPENPGQDME